MMAFFISIYLPNPAKPGSPGPGTVGGGPNSNDWGVSPTRRNVVVALRAAESMLLAMPETAGRVCASRRAAAQAISRMLRVAMASGPSGASSRASVPGRLCQAGDLLGRLAGVARHRLQRID
ncbi:hypothetical protein OMF50_21030, partial [Bordetella pertussis]